MQELRVKIGSAGMIDETCDVAFEHRVDVMSSYTFLRCL